MAYRLKRKELIEEGIRRIAQEQATNALHAITCDLNPFDERVHDARTCCKKLRGLLRLIRPQLGKIYRRENATIRDAARSLAGARDAAVVSETFDTLTKSCPDAVSEVRRELVIHLNQFGGASPTETELARFADAMIDLRERIEGWSIADPGFDAVGCGFAETYRRGRTGLEAVQDSDEVEAWHEWRKLVKYHWYHVRLLRNVWTPVMKARASELRRLSDLLGEHHDLVVLQGHLQSVAGFGSSSVEQVLSLLKERKNVLERSALPYGVRIYGEKPKAFRRRMSSLWRAWKSEPA